MQGKVVATLQEAISLTGLKSGMTVSFHHHLRNGDYVLNMVMEQIAQMGIGHLTVHDRLHVCGTGKGHLPGDHGGAGGVPHPRRAAQRHRDRGGAH